MESSQGISEKFSKSIELKLTLFLGILLIGVLLLIWLVLPIWNIVAWVITIVGTIVYSLFLIGIISYAKSLKKEKEINIKTKSSSVDTSDNAYDFFEQGRKKFDNGHFKEALYYYDLAIKSGFKDSSAYDLYYDRAMCLKALDRNIEAINDFDKAIALNSVDPHRYFCRSLSKWEIKDFKGRVADIEKAIELSKVNNQNNREYDLKAQKMGYSNATLLLEMQLSLAKIDAGDETELKKWS